MNDLIRDIARFKRLWGELVDLRRKPVARVEGTFDDLPKLVDLQVEAVDLLKDLAGAMEVRGMDSTALWDFYGYFGAPTQDQWYEVVIAPQRLDARVRAEFTSLAEARALGTAWRLEYNHRRPHNSLGYRTPAEYSAGCASVPLGSLKPRGTRRVIRDSDLSNMTSHHVDL